MNRLALTVRSTRLQALPVSARATAAVTSLPFRGPIRGYATSSPKKAEEASAKSGGSRSKDAVEERAQVEMGENPTEDRLAKGGAPGRTGGGESLASSENAPPRPKVNNASIPAEGKNTLSKEQQEEVDEHNRDFEKKHDRASPAADDKVDKDFWKGHGGMKE